MAQHLEEIAATLIAAVAFCCARGLGAQGRCAAPAGFVTSGLFLAVSSTAALRSRPTRACSSSDAIGQGEAWEGRLRPFARP
jgi:hypothetical protein